MLLSGRGGARWALGAEEQGAGYNNYEVLVDGSEDRVSVACLMGPGREESLRGAWGRNDWDLDLRKGFLALVKPYCPELGTSRRFWDPQSTGLGF